MIVRVDPVFFKGEGVGRTLELQNQWNMPLLKMLQFENGNFVQNCSTKKKITMLQTRHYSEVYGQSASAFIACEYSRLSFPPATTCETRGHFSYVVAGANERRLYSQGTAFISDKYSPTFSCQLLLHQ